MTFAWDELLTFGLAGAAIGFLSGVFGLGGGFLIVPVLHILLRVPMNLAVGAGACQVLGPATTSLLARRPQREHFRVPVMIFGGQLLGTFVGAGVLESAQHYGTDGAVELAGRTVPMIDLLVLSLYFILLSSIGMFAVWESRRCAADGTARGWLADFPLPPFCTPIDFERDRVSIPLLAWFGLFVGFLAGLLGMSGGLLLLPGLVYLMGINTHAAIRATLIIVWLGAIPNTIVHAWNDNIDLWLVSALLVGGTIGARLGSEVGKRWAGPKLRQRFGWLLLATAAMIAWRLSELLIG